MDDYEYNQPIEAIGTNRSTDDDSRDDDDDYEDDDASFDDDRYHPEDVDDDDDEHVDDDNDDDEVGVVPSSRVGEGVGAREIRQHLLAIFVAIFAAVIAHSRMHGGFDSWTEELARDWSTFRRRRRADGGGKAGMSSTAGSTTPSPNHRRVERPKYAAPSMDAIPVERRGMILDRALRDLSTGGEEEEEGDVGDVSSIGGGGHALARDFRRTRGLNFCTPPHPSSSSSSSSSSSTSSSSLSNAVAGSRSDDAEVENDHNRHHLTSMEFILPLDPSVRVLNYHYLADALGIDDVSAIVMRGEYDGMLDEIDAIIEEGGIAMNDMSTLILLEERIESILDAHLPPKPTSSSSSHYPRVGRRQHVCLLRQYALNRPTGWSIRGSTMVYDRPHVSTYYRGRNDDVPSYSSLSTPSSSSMDDALSVISRGRVKPNYKVSPASLSFTGYAAKFINLSVNPVNLYWDGGRVPTGPNAGEMRTVLVGTIRGMGTIGTSTFPGHTFHVTPTYDRDHVLQRWTITGDEPVLYHDPLSDMSAVERIRAIDGWTRDGKWTEVTRFERDAWIVDRSFGRDYLVKTGRAWLANFPQPYLATTTTTTNAEPDRGGDDGDGVDVPSFSSGSGTKAPDGHRMHMWRADYIGQTHDVITSSLYYNSLPERLERLTGDDYHPEVEKERLAKMRQFQSSSLKERKITGDNGDDATMRLTLSVLSCAPRVLEAKKFLSPVEVQHLIDLASGAKGGVIMKRSTVSATNVDAGDGTGSGRKAKGSEADVRSSTGGWIHREQDAIVDTIFRRIADLLNIDERLMRDIVRDRPGNDDSGEDEWLPTHDRIVEAMQLLRYKPGEEYAPHHDFTHPSITNRYQPKRYATVLLYLTGEGDVIENGVRRSPASLSKKTGSVEARKESGLQGGETTFPRAITTNRHDGIKVKPQSGNAIIFYNVLPDGNMDDLSQHSGGKVDKGVKYVANVWVWDPIVN